MQITRKSKVLPQTPKQRHISLRKLPHYSSKSFLSATTFSLFKSYSETEFDRNERYILHANSNHIPISNPHYHG